MLAFITNLNITEMGIVLIGAIMVFGKDLPRVVVRGLQHLAKLRKAVVEMWQEAGLEQEFKRVKAELDPEIAEAAAARKALRDGKDLLNGPVAHWRKTIGMELEDVVEVGSKVKASEPSDGGAENFADEDFEAEEIPDKETASPQPKSQPSTGKPTQAEPD